VSGRRIDQRGALDDAGAPGASLRQQPLGHVRRVDGMVFRIA
jgi:hypothetical protein